MIGFIDEQKMILSDIHDNIFMKITEDGRIENGQSIVVGTSKPFRPFLFRVISSFLWFFDPALAGEGHSSLVTNEKGKGTLNSQQKNDEKEGSEKEKKGTLKKKIPFFGSVFSSSFS